MKKFTILSLLLGCSLLVLADDAAILSKIEQKNSAMQSEECAFTQVKSVTATKSKTNLAGNLYYVAPGQLAMHYTQPATDLLVINGTKFHLNRNGKANTFNTSKNAPMRSLSNTLLYCIQGKVVTLATENNANYSVKDDGKFYVVVLTAKTKVARGYKCIILKYAKSDLLLVSMQMDEVAGISNLYTMSNFKTNGKVDATLFNIPKK